MSRAPLRASDTTEMTGSRRFLLTSLRDFSGSRASHSVPEELKGREADWTRARVFPISSGALLVSCTVTPSPGRMGASREPKHISILSKHPGARKTKEPS